MTNPYSTPQSNISQAKADNEPQHSNSLRWFASAASVLAIGILMLIAFLLIPQALRLASENASLPPRLQSANAAGASSSWIGGIVAACGVVANIIGLFLIRARRVALPLAICAASVACMVAIAIVFKPT
ncbi:MAG: hypothetical protein SFV81_15695 [Pirellulaceae bacterium]|nr:hypothetical protein [Pirellulaceae bacterium]